MITVTNMVLEIKPPTGHWPKLKIEGDLRKYCYVRYFQFMINYISQKCIYVCVTP